ncbi:MAG: hypothetical protein PHW04_13220 [Candidatus Wallbacteria bacterium]|nr:hypothetical protein [Candidatus Wallbacteria bacterium]
MILLLVWRLPELKSNLAERCCRRNLVELNQTLEKHLFVRANSRSSLQSDASLSSLEIVTIRSLEDGKILCCPSCGTYRVVGTGEIFQVECMIHGILTNK